VANRQVLLKGYSILGTIVLVISEPMSDVKLLIRNETDEFLHRVKGGEQSAIEDFIARYQSVVLRIVTSKVPAQERSELVQTVFINALQSIATYDERKPIENWLSRIAVCKCYDYWRSQKKRASSVNNTACIDWAQNEFYEGMRLENAAIDRAKELTELALNVLSAEDRMVVSLAYLDGIAVKEVAELLGWSQVGVRVRLHRGKKRMRAFLSDLLSGGQGDES
jgi:RNA polymerase sigma-70 factor, ECF subfamily